MAELDADALDRIEAFLASRLPVMPDAPGAVVGLADRERVLGVVAAGLADAFTREPVTTDTRFEIGSISKSFAAIVAMQEVEAGRLDLRIPVTTYVPWFEVRSEHGPITAHHLLTHTSGLIEGMEFADAAVPAVLALRETTVGFAPGERFLYSNDAYKLLGLILEAVTGRSIRTLLRERIFEPLGMTRTDPAITYETLADVATAHERLRDDRTPHRNQPLVPSPRITSTTADGSIVSTAADMAAYARMLCNRGEGPSGRLLTEASFEQLVTPHVEVPDERTAYGYGLDVFEVDGRPHVGHAGGMVGQYALLWCDLATGVASVMMVNGLGEREDVVRFGLDVLRARAEGSALPEVTPAPDPLAVEGVTDLPGTFAGPRGSLALVADGEHLVLRLGGTEVTLEPWSKPDSFAVPHPDLDRFLLRVVRADDGTVAEVLHGPDAYLREGAPSPQEPSLPEGWTAFPGTYRSYNPWALGFRVFARRGRLFVAWPGDERELEPMPDGSFRVGEAWSPDRVRFDAVIDGLAQRAVYNAQVYHRSFLE